MLAWHVPELHTRMTSGSELDGEQKVHLHFESEVSKCSRGTWAQATYSTTRAGAPVEEGTGNPHYFCFHLPQTREYIRMERITPGKLFVHLQKTETKLALQVKPWIICEEVQVWELAVHSTQTDFLQICSTFSRCEYTPQAGKLCGGGWNHLFF